MMHPLNHYRTYQPVDRDFDGSTNPYRVLIVEGQISREAVVAIQRRHDPRFADDDQYGAR